MTKIRCGDSLAIDLTQVIAWVRGKRRLALKNNEVLFLYLAGIDKPVSVDQDDIGCQAFDRLYELLLDQFPIDLTVTADISDPKDD